MVNPFNVYGSRPKRLFRSNRSGGKAGIGDGEQGSSLEGEPDEEESEDGIMHTVVSGSVAPATTAIPVVLGTTKLSTADATATTTTNDNSDTEQPQNTTNDTGTTTTTTMTSTNTGAGAGAGAAEHEQTSLAERPPSKRSTAARIEATEDQTGNADADADANANANANATDKRKSKAKSKAGGRRGKARPSARSSKRKLNSK